MLRRIHTALMLSLLALPLTVAGCEKKDKGEKTENPDDATAEGGDPVAELIATPDKLQAEVDAVLKPIDDAEKLMADLEAIPAKYSLSLDDFKGMVQANFAVTEEGAEIQLSADLSIAAEAQEELKATIRQIKDVKVALETTPDRIATATLNIAKIGEDSIALALEVVPSLTAKLKVAMGDKKAEIQGQLDAVMALKDQIPSLVTDAQAKLTEIPARATEIGASFTTSFAASAG